MAGEQWIDDFLASGPYAVVGASTDRSKYGNKVLRAYLLNDMEVFPVNPKADEIEGQTALPSLAAAPQTVRGVSIITPPHVTEQIVDDAADAGAEFVWMQPGAESDAAFAKAEQRGLKVIGGGPCILVKLHYRET